MARVGGDGGQEWTCNGHITRLSTSHGLTGYGPLLTSPRHRMKCAGAAADGCEQLRGKWLRAPHPTGHQQHALKKTQLTRHRHRFERAGAAANGRARLKENRVGAGRRAVDGRHRGAVGNLLENKLRTVQSGCEAGWCPVFRKTGSSTYAAQLSWPSW